MLIREDGGRLVLHLRGSRQSSLLVGRLHRHWYVLQWLRVRGSRIWLAFDIRRNAWLGSVGRRLHELGGGVEWSRIGAVDVGEKGLNKLRGTQRRSEWRKGLQWRRFTRITYPWLLREAVATETREYKKSSTAHQAAWKHVPQIISRCRLIATRRIAALALVRIGTHGQNGEGLVTLKDGGSGGDEVRLDGLVQRSAFWLPKRPSPRNRRIFQWITGRSCVINSAIWSHNQRSSVRNMDHLCPLQLT